MPVIPFKTQAELFAQTDNSIKDNGSTDVARTRGLVHRQLEKDIIATIFSVAAAIDSYYAVSRYVPNIAARNLLETTGVPPLENTELVWVEDASADVNVGSGWAIYRWIEETTEWILFAKQETISINLADYQAVSQKNQSNGYAGLNSNGRIDPVRLLELIDDSLQPDGINAGSRTWSINQIRAYISANLPSGTTTRTQTAINLASPVIDLSEIGSFDIIDLNALIDITITSIVGGILNKEYTFRATGAGNISFTQAVFDLEGQIDYELEAQYKDSIVVTRFTDETRWRQVGGVSYGPANFGGGLAAPIALAATDITQTSFRANWTVVAGALGYTLTVSTDIAGNNPVAGYNNKSVVGTTDLVTGLTLGTQYYYTVKASNTNFQSVASNRIDVLTQAVSTVPSTPTDFSTTRIGARSISLSWNTNSNTTGYKILRSVTLVGGYTEIANVSTITYIDANLVDGTDYYYKIVAYNAIGDSVSSVSLPATTYQIDSFLVGGDSYSTQPAFGLSAGQGWVDLMGVAYAATINNQAIGGRGVYALVENFRPITRNSSPILIMAGLNDIRRGGGAAQTSKKIYNCLKSAITRFYLASGVGFTNSSAWAASDSWFPYFNNFDAEYASVLGGGQGIFTQVANKTLIGSRSINQNLVVGYFADQSQAEPFEIFVGGISQGIFSGNLGCDGISDGVDDNIRCPATEIIPLSAGNYSVEIISRNIAGNFCMLDYAGTMILPELAERIYVSKIPALPNASWGLGSGTDLGSEAIRQATNAMIANLVQEFQTLGYPVFLCDPDQGFNPATDMQADQIHRNPIGMSKIATSIQQTID